MTYEFITPSIEEHGKILANIIRTNMQSFIGGNAVLPDCIQCMVDIHPKNSMGMISHYVLASSISTYLNNYSIVETVLSGVACNNMPTTPSVVKFSASTPTIMYGDVKLNAPIWFLFMGNKLTMPEDPITVPKDALAELLNVVADWLTFPQVKTESHYVDGSASITGHGHVMFTNVIPVSVRSIVDEAFAKMEAIRSRSDYKPNDPKLFEKYWDIVSSAIVSMMYQNDVISTDDGVVFYNAMPIIGMGSAGFNGLSMGSVKFSLTPYIKPNLVIFTIPFSKIKIPPVPELPDLSIYLPLHFPFDVLFPKQDTQTGHIEPFLDIDIEWLTDAISKIGSDITKLISTICEAIEYAIETVLDKLDEIGHSQAVADIASFIESAWNKISDMTDMVTKWIDSQIIQPIKKIIGEIVMSIVAGIVTAILDNIPQTKVVATVMTSLKIVTDLSTIKKAIGDTKDGLEKAEGAVKKAKEVAVDRGEQIAKKLEDKKQEISANDKCGCVAAIVKLIPGVGMAEVIGKPFDVVIGTIGAIRVPVDAADAIVSAVPTSIEVPPADIKEFNKDKADKDKVDQAGYVKAKADEAGKGVSEAVVAALPTPPMPSIPKIGIGPKTYPSGSPESVFNETIEDTLRLEGGSKLVNNVNAGGLTRWGITQITYNEYCNKVLKQKAPYPKVATVTKTDAIDIGKILFWDKSKCAEVADSMPLLAKCHFDFSFLTHPSRAKDMIRKIKIKNKSSFEGGDDKTLTNIYVDERIIFHRNRVKQNPSLQKYLTEWISRAESFRVS